MSILRQNHPIYPLSLGENIALGLPDMEPDVVQVNAAIRDGGAYGFVQKLPKKLDTVLSPMKMSEGNLTTKDAPKLQHVFDEEVVTDVSGGERQRLAAYNFPSVVSNILLLKIYQISHLHATPRRSCPIPRSR